MHHDYADIRAKIAEPPTWWDEYAVPRYCPFAPNQVANIYAEHVALVWIACQNCGAAFRVAMSGANDGMSGVNDGPVTDLRPRIADGTLHYGDPPNTGCCLSGPTMNCRDLKVEEFWSRERDENNWPEWRRLPVHEVLLQDHPEHPKYQDPDLDDGSTI